MEITVTVENVDLSSVINADMVQVGEEEYSARPSTLGDEVARQLVGRLVRTADYSSLETRVREIRMEEIRAQLRPVIAAEIVRPIQRTSAYGSPVGDPKPLAELIAEQVREVLNSGGDSYRSGESLLRKVIREEVARSLESELREAIRAEKEKVVAVVRAKAAELIAESIKAGIRS